MKLEKLDGSKNTLPDAQTVCEIIMRLPPPVHVMGWVMAETGCRLSDLQMMRVSDFCSGDNILTICTEQGCNRADISPGLCGALSDYLYQLRERFERHKRGSFPLGKNKPKRTHMFSDQRLFPAWSMTGYEKSDIDLPFPSGIFAHELLVAAQAVSYTGLMHSNTLRLYCTSRWIKEGLDVSAIHQRLGHTDVLTTILMVQALRKEGLTYLAATEDVVEMPVANVA